MLPGYYPTKIGYAILKWKVEELNYRRFGVGNVKIGIQMAKL